jgi:hypothetical protein
MGVQYGLDLRVKRKQPSTTSAAFNNSSFPSCQLNPVGNGCRSPFIGIERPI